MRPWLVASTILLSRFPTRELGSRKPKQKCANLASSYETWGMHSLRTCLGWGGLHFILKQHACMYVCMMLKALANTHCCYPNRAPTPPLLPWLLREAQFACSKWKLLTHDRPTPTAYSPNHAPQKGSQTSHQRHCKAKWLLNCFPHENEGDSRPT